MKRFLLLGVVLLGGCGGGGGGNYPPPTQKLEILSWEQDNTHFDNTPMDIKKEVSHWDIYCSFFPTFNDNDLVASIANVDNVELNFNMGLLRAHGINPGAEGKFVTVRCIGKDNEASDFPEIPTFWKN